MTYEQIKPIAKSGKLIALPNFIGFFKWDYNTNDIEFVNKDFRCPATQLNILNRYDFYQII